MKKQVNKSHKSDKEEKKLHVGHVTDIKAPLFDAVVENTWGKKK